MGATVAMARYHGSPGWIMHGFAIRLPSTVYGRALDALPEPTAIDGPRVIATLWRPFDAARWVRAMAERAAMAKDILDDLATIDRSRP